MTEHPAWLITDDHAWRRVFAVGEDRYLATVTGSRVDTTALVGESALPKVDRFDGHVTGRDLGRCPQLQRAVRDLGVVGRFGNSSLWDALGTAVIRQVIRAAQAKKLYRAFCLAHGERVELPGGGSYALFPSPETVRELRDEQFAAAGLAFKARALRAAADAFLDMGVKWRDLPAPALVEELQTVPRVGAWTAGAAVADYTNDWSLYPYGDLAVRTWARRAAPAFAWPHDEPAFAACWRGLAGTHLSALTVLTLAWGSHHGDIG